MPTSPSHPRITAAILLVMLLFVNASQSVAASQPVLMLGNSFTAYVHGSILRRDIYDARWVGGWNLDQHFRDGTSRSKMCSAGQFVVMQDFSTRPASLDLFLTDVEEISQFVRECRKQPVLFMTWETNAIAFSTIKSGTDLAAARNNLQVIAIGAVWNEVRKSSESFYQSLLQSDGKHPTERGAKIGAAAMLKAFCESCYQSFNWSGFTSGEVAFLKSQISALISPIKAEELPPIDPPVDPEEDKTYAYMASIIRLLLD